MTSGLCDSVPRGTGWGTRRCAFLTICTLVCGACSADEPSPAAPDGALPADPGPGKGEGAPTPEAAADFLLLDPSPPGRILSWQSLSGDGRTLVGMLYDIDVPMPAGSGDGSGAVARAPDEIRVWTRAGGIVPLPGIAAGVSAGSPVVNADGSVIALYLVGGSGALWQDGRVDDLPLPAGASAVSVVGLSADGTAFTGPFSSEDGGGSYWSSANGSAIIGGSSGQRSNEVNAISGSGRVTAGNLFFATEDCVVQGYSWTPEGGAVLLPPCSSMVYDVNFDGSVVVGTVQDRDAHMAVWRDGELEVIGARPSIANAVNADGSVIVGASEAQAIIWTRDAGPRRLDDVLVEQGVDLDGWALRDVIDVSDDGKTLVGVGEKDEQFRSWVARLP